ncbi:MAG: helix-turn-helix domain-containing protein [Moorellales bacterium]
MAELAMSVAEAARALGVSRDAVYELVRRKEIPHVRVGRRVIIPRRGLEEWLTRAASPQEDRGRPQAVPAPGAAVTRALPAWGALPPRRGRG